MTITLLYTPADSALGLRIRGDLEARQMPVTNQVQPGKEALTLVLLSPVASADGSIQQAIVDALENHQHVIPIMAMATQLPRLIDHLQPIDYSSSYDVQLLLWRIEALSAPDAPPPLTALTPSVRASNRRAGLALGVMALVVFVLALIGIGLGITVPPEDQFASVETQIYLTRNYFIDEALPRSTEQAQGFQATIEQVPTRARVQLILTATAIAERVQAGFVPRSTEEATHFQMTLRAVSTIVRDDLAQLATQAASP